MDPVRLPFGALVPVAYAAQTSSEPGEWVAAAVACAVPHDPTQAGLIMEFHGTGWRGKDAEEHVREMAKQGFFGVPFPREYGGAGLGEVGYCILLEELAAAEASLGTTIGAHTGIGTMPIWLFGTQEQRERYLPALCKGERLAAFCLTEPTAGSDAASIKTRAVREGWQKYFKEDEASFDFEAALASWGPRAYRRLHWECGFLGQLVYLEAEALGLRGTGIGCFFDDPVHQVFGFKDLAFQSLYHFTVGGPVDDPRLTTLPPGFEAHPKVERGLAQHPKHPGLLYNRALAHSAQRQYQAAVPAFRAALGVECNFCHVFGDKGERGHADERHLDGNPKKLVARNMIGMLEAINAALFPADAVDVVFAASSIRSLMNAVTIITSVWLKFFRMYFIKLCPLTFGISRSVMTRSIGLVARTRVASPTLGVVRTSYPCEHRCLLSNSSMLGSSSTMRMRSLSVTDAMVDTFVGFFTCTTNDNLQLLPADTVWTESLSCAHLPAPPS